MDTDVPFKEFMETLLKGIMCALEIELIDDDIFEETLTYGVRPNERKREVVPFQDLEIPSRIFIVGKVAYRKRQMLFFLIFYVTVERRIELGAVDVYDTVSGREPPKEGESRTMKALMIFLESLKEAI